MVGKEIGGNFYDPVVKVKRSKKEGLRDAESSIGGFESRYALRLIRASMTRVPGSLLSSFGVALRPLRRKPISSSFL